MLYNFNKFLNESKEDEFNTLVPGDIVLHRGFRCEVKSVFKDKNETVDAIKINSPQGKDHRTLSLAQFKQQVSGVIKKEKTEKDED
jgi:hypothetical protein